METREITQEERDRLIGDISWLQDEAEALQYVIDSVPVRETPPGGRSIAEMLLLIDHAQQEYYRPVLMHAPGRSKPYDMEQHPPFDETFEMDPGKAEDVQRMLQKIAKHRAALVNTATGISLIDWETPLNQGEQRVMLFDFIRGMVRWERSVLKEIAEQVRIWHQDREAHRELEQRRKQRNN